MKLVNVKVGWICAGCGKTGEIDLVCNYRGPVPSLEEQISFLVAARSEAESVHPDHPFRDVKLVDPLDAARVPRGRRGPHLVN